VSRLGHFARIPWRSRVLLIEAAIAVALSSLAITLLPFRRLCPLMSWTGKQPLGRQEQSEAWLTEGQWAVEAAARLLPWKIVCFQKGLALHWMMNRRGIPTKLNYGVARQKEKGVAAHVWISFGDTIIMGGETAGEFAQVASFPSPTLRSRPPTAGASEE
jgi:hypothetical protein